MNKIYFYTIPAVLFLFLAALPGAYGQTTDPKCAFVNDTDSISIYPSAAFFNYGSGTNIRNTSRTMNLSIGQLVVDAAWNENSVFTSEFGYWGQFLVPPQAPMVTATQGQLLDRIQIKWALEPLGSLPSGGFNLYRDSVFLATVANNIRTYNDFFVIAGTPYNYEVRGVNIYGEGIGGKAIGFQVPNGTVTGWVQTSNGTPVPDAFVALTPVQGYSVKFGPDGGAFAESNPGIEDALLPPDGVEWTLAFWVKTESAEDGAAIVGLEPFPFLLRPIESASGHEGIEVAQTDGSPALLRAQFPDSTKNGWHHVAFTMDDDNMGRLYIDGVLADIGSVVPVPSATELRIGSRTGAKGAWSGYLDELRMYHRRLDELDLGEAKMGTASSLTPGLKYYWKMDEQLGPGSFDVLKRNRMYFCDGEFSDDIPPVRTMGKTNEEGYYRIESANYGTGTTFLAEPMKDFYMYRALKFVRDSQSYATLPNFSVTPKATLEMWVNSAGPDNVQCLLSKTWQSNDFRLLLEPNGNSSDIKFYLTGQEHNFGPLGMGYRHLAFTIDSSGTNRIVTAYNNGILVGSHTFTGVSGNWSDPSAPWMLGARPNGGGQTDYYGGLIDEVVLYDTTLSVDSIYAHYQNSRDPQGKGLRVYFAMDEGSGNRLNNSGSVLMPSGTAFKTAWTPFAARQKTEAHEFSPKTRQVTLNPSVTSADQVDFIDRSLVPVSGYVRYKNTDCFAPNVEIWVDGASFSPKIFTDSSGRFVVDFDPGKTATLTPVFADHHFEPAFWDVNNVVSPITGIVFNDETTRTVSGHVAGGLCKKSIIRAPAGDALNDGGVCIVEVRSGECFNRQIKIDNQQGEFEFLDLPPLERMTVAVIEHSDEPVKIFFEDKGGSTVDLSKTDTIIDFIYFAPPEVAIKGGLVPEPGCSPLVYVLKKDEVATLQIGMQETYTPTVDNMNAVIDDGVCPLDTANFRIINFIGEQVFDTVMSGGVLEYSFLVKNPNPSPPYLKSIQIVGTSVGGRTASLVREVIVTGLRTKEKTFTTLLPETPSVILRDPPGDGSYAFLEENSKVCKTHVVSLDFEVGGGGGLEVSLGPDVLVSFGIGVETIVETDLTLDIATEFQVTYQKITDSTFQTCTTIKEKLSTDKGELIVGGEQGADIYMGEAINIIFGFADMVTFDTCTVTNKTVVEVEPGDFSTVFMYSERYIEKNVTRYLKDLILFSNPSPADSARYAQSISRWEKIIERNAGLKEKAKLVRNLSFDAGISYEFSETIDSSFATSTEDFVNSEESISTHIGLEVLGVGVGGSIKFISATSKSTKNEDGSEKGLTTGYVLADNDPGDAFTVDVALDSAYKTPVFRTKAGQSSCPWEPETAHREGNELTFRDGSGALAINVPANEPAVYKFYFDNVSATNETFTYAFTAGPESNPHGAKIFLNGAALDHPVFYAIPFGTSIPVTVTLERGPEEYEYDSLELVLYSLCEDLRANALGILPDDDTILYSAQYISAHFIRPCSEVDINVPEQDYVILANDTLQPGTKRRITVSGYDTEVPDFRLIRMQYRRADAGGVWINLPTPTGIFEAYNPKWSGFYNPQADTFRIPKPDTSLLQPNFKQFIWETAGMADGPYELRAITECTGQSPNGYSQTVRVRIDREPPSLVGVPQPSDGVYHVGDEVSFTFNQHVNCNKLNPVDDVLLFDVTENRQIEIAPTCFENKIVFDPTFNNEEFENHILRAELHNIEDLVGNKGTYFKWEFFVDRNELAWLTDSAGTTKYVDEPKSFTANIHNRGGYPVPFTISGAPDWLHIAPNAGTLVANEIRPITFTIDSSLAFGRWADTIVLETQTGQNPFFMGGSEPLPLGVRVVCRPPYDGFNADLYENSMTMVLKVNIEGTFSSDPEDMVAAFIDDELRGRAHIQFIPQLNDYRALLFIYGDPSDMLKPIRLEVWDASQCERYGSVLEQFTFQPDNAIGTLTNPQVIHTGGLLLREVPFNYGWNWLSFNLAFPDNSLNAALASVKHPENDLMKGQTAFSEYFGGWFGTLNNLNNTAMYIYRADVADTLRMQGLAIDPATTPIPVVAGWNWIGYVPNYALPINTALASLPAQPGDVIKGQHAFSEYLNPTFGWVGNLKYMSPPNGYQIRLAQAGTLTYPPKPTSLVEEETAQARGETESPPAHWTVNARTFEHTNTLIGMLRANGANATTSDMELGAFAGGEVRGTAQAIYIEPLDAHLFFLTTYANVPGELLRFKLYNDADGSVRDLSETMYFAPNQHQGNIENPVPFELLTTAAPEDLAAALAFDVQPNPFSSETTIRFALSKAEEVMLTISDAQGREVVRRPVSAAAGPNVATWNGRSDTGSWLSSGVYTLRLQTAAGSVVRKVVLQRLP